MAVPSSGEIKLSGIWNEFDNSDYTDSGHGSDENISLKELSTGIVDTINTQNASSDRPDGSAPHSMSEFYAYDHDYSSTVFSPLNLIADFTMTTNINTTLISGLKTFTVNNGTGGFSNTLVDTNSNTFGTLARSISSTGDPGTGGSNNSATGWVTQGTTSSLVVSWNASHIFYVRYKFQGHSGAASDVARNTFTVNGVSDSVDITKVSNDPGRSDIRLKTNIERIGYSDMNIPIYLFNYKEDLNTTYKGVMAQDLLELGFKDSVKLDYDGYYSVDYNSIDVDMERV